MSNQRHISIETHKENLETQLYSRERDKLFHIIQTQGPMTGAHAQKIAFGKYNGDHAGRFSELVRQKKLMIDGVGYCPVRRASATIYKARPTSDWLKSPGKCEQSLVPREKIHELLDFLEQNDSPEASKLWAQFLPHA